MNLISIGIGAILGAWSRYSLGVLLNPIFPTIPFGTLIANLVGGFIMGIFMTLTREYHLFSETTRLAIATGFLGSLTTFSTFSAETVTLFTHQEVVWGCLIILAHVVGSLVCTFAGIYLTKVII